MLACTESGTLSRTFTVLCTQQRWCRVPGKTSSSAFQKRTVANGNFRGDLQSALLHVDQELTPTLRALPDADLKADQLLLAFRRRADQHQHAFAVVFHARLQEDAIGPHIHVASRRQIALLPALVLALPLRRQPGDYRR